MRPVLILQHQTPERPAYLTTWLDQHGIAHETRNAGRGERFPSSIEPYAALAVMGGGMSANDDLMSNRQAEILILQAVLRGRPVIGHCLGGQLMTRALGGEVTASPQPEIGWQPIQWRTDILTEQWFGRQPTPRVAQWHYEAIPPRATLLATSGACENQAWALGPHLAMQFHIEIDADKAREWAADGDDKWADARAQYSTVQSAEEIVAGIEPYLAQHQATADHVYRRWLMGSAWADALRTHK
jgi:GMP synthase-like glutamine amidotransferase